MIDEYQITKKDKETFELSFVAKGKVIFKDLYDKCVYRKKTNTYALEKRGHMHIEIAKDKVTYRG